METATGEIKREVPFFIKGLGTLTMAVAGVCFILILHFLTDSSKAALGYSYIDVFELVIAFWLFRIGLVMRTGKKEAIYASIILVMFVLLVEGLSYNDKAVEIKLIAGIILLLSLLSIISGLWKWNKLH